MSDANKETLVAPDYMVEGPNGSVIADPSKIPTPTPNAQEKAGTPERPEWLDEKFQSPEDLAKAYKELEKKLGAQPKPETKPAEQTLTPEQVTEKGFNMKDLQAEYAQHGDITKETRAKLAEKGITGEAVDLYIAGVKATTERVRSEFAEIAGGSEEQLTSVLEWAKANLSKEEADGFDALLDSGNNAAAKLAFQSIVSRFNAENGEAPSLVDATRVPSIPGVKPYESREQMVKDMNKPEYRNDPAFRAKVEQRLSVTTAF